MYEIDHDVPLPTIRKYPFAKMVVGDSFLVPFPPGTDAGAYTAALRSRCAAWGKKHGGKFKVRIEDARATARVWRVA